MSLGVGFPLDIPMKTQSSIPVHAIDECHILCGLNQGYRIRSFLDGAFDEFKKRVMNMK